MFSCYPDTTFFFFYVLGCVLIFHMLFSLPLSQAFLKGIRAANDPGHRVTPTSPEVFFRRTFWKSIRLWIPLWMLMITAQNIFYRFKGLPNHLFGEESCYLSIFGFAAPAFLVGMGFWCGSVNIFWSPRFRSSNALAGLATTIALALSLFCVCIGIFITENSVWVWHSLPFAAVFNIIVSIVVFWLFRNQVLRIGERWFRFDTV